MPKRYEAIRDRLRGEGASLKEAKTRAAKIYNATRKPSEPKLSSHEKHLRKHGL